MFHYLGFHLIVFLTVLQGTQIQATMFKEAADKFMSLVHMSIQGILLVSVLWLKQ
jgi:hypothetical protein